METISRIFHLDVPVTEFNISNIVNNKIAELSHYGWAVNDIKIFEYDTIDNNTCSIIKMQRFIFSAKKKKEYALTSDNPFKDPELIDKTKDFTKVAVSKFGDMVFNKIFNNTHLNKYF